MNSSYYVNRLIVAVSVVFYACLTLALSMPALPEKATKKSDSAKVTAAPAAATEATVRSKKPLREKKFLLKPFITTALDGSEISIEELKGQPFVLNFWASWCPPCKLEAKTLEQSYRDHKKHGVRFVGVAIQDREQGARAFIKRYDITYPNALDIKDKIGRDYNVLGMPWTIIADSEGRVSYSHLGVITAEILSREIGKLL
ncbi:MAG: TlpA disulfide reductase family protein [Thermodesulfobacteriota bacterium]